jgi:hypothetical protein
MLGDDQASAPTAGTSLTPQSGPHAQVSLTVTPCPLRAVPLSPSPSACCCRLPRPAEGLRRSCLAAAPCWGRMPSHEQQGPCISSERCHAGAVQAAGRMGHQLALGAGQRLLAGLLISRGTKEGVAERVVASLPPLDSTHLSSYTCKQPQGPHMPGPPLPLHGPTLMPSAMHSLPACQHLAFMNQPLTTPADCRG